MMNNYQSFFIFLIIFTSLFSYWLNSRQINHVLKNKSKVPKEFSKIVKPKDHKKAAEYTIAKTKFSSFELVVSSLILYFLTLGGGINLINNLIGPYFENTLLSGSFIIVSTFLFLSLIGIPSSIYSQFVIEEKFGFNKMKLKLFWMDTFKTILLTIIIATPIAYAALWIIFNLGNLWWIWLWGFISIVLLLVNIFYPIVKQLFNEFKPLKDKVLKSNLEKLLKKCGFVSSGLFVMNGSLRSTHGNAFFGGFGKTKRIVFFDTLLKKLSHKEVEAVIAHELGHFHHNHIKKQLAFSIGFLFIALFFLGDLKDNEFFYSVLGVDLASDTNFILLLILVIIPFLSFFMQPYMAFKSRKAEYEADEYACEHAKSRDLKQSLTKLYRDNASTLTPDPLFSFFNHSHPPALMRLKAIDNK